MRSVEVSSLITLLRATLEEHEELWTPLLPLGCDPAELSTDTPPGVAELLRVCNGPYLDHSTQLYSIGDLPYRQISDNLVGARLPNGADVADAKRFFCFGQACLNPLLADITDGSVWRVPDDGVVWYTGFRLERISDSVSSFFTDWVASPRFQDLAGLDGEDLECSDWYRLLRLSGVVPW